MIPFEQASELAQARRLRKLATQALKQYSLTVRKLHFIQNGENATFQVIDQQKNKYLLRIHRYGYHSPQAIHEELQWLSDISKTMKVPEPINSISGSKLISASHPHLPHPRYCTVLKWVDGRFLWKYTNEGYMKKLGSLVARLQKLGKKQKIKHRSYWTVDGLIGKKSKFGTLENVEGISKKDQKKLINARQKIYQIAKEYEDKNPKKQGLIHSDLHFGNYVVNNQELCAIDFDDCGTGMYCYDLAVCSLSLRNLVDHEKRNDFEPLYNAILQGYTEHIPLDKEDVEMITLFAAIRKLTMISWLQSRSEILTLKKRIPKAAESTLLFIKENLGCGGKL